MAIWDYFWVVLSSEPQFTRVYATGRNFFWLLMAEVSGKFAVLTQVKMPSCKRPFCDYAREHSRNLPIPSRTFELGRIAPASNRLILLKSQAEY
jgi:hypothetical protein